MSADVPVTPQPATSTSIVLDPFTVSVPTDSTPETWAFDDLAISDSTGNANCLVATTVRITDPSGITQSFRFSGLPIGGIRPPTAILIVTNLSQGFVGTLLVVNWGGLTITFIPANGDPRVPVDVMGSSVHWTSGGASYYGERFSFNVGANQNGVVVSHGFAGTVNERKRTDDDWEAKASFPLTTDVDLLAASGLAYPAGTYRMIIAPGKDSGNPVSSARGYNGFVELSIQGGKFAVTVYSGVSKPVTAEVTYVSKHATYGTIGMFEVNICGEKWEFAQIEVFQSGGVTYLHTFDLSIGDKVVSLSGFPLSEIPVPKNLAVQRGGKPAGELKLTSHTSGSFHHGLGTPEGSPVSIHDQITILWVAESKLWTGFPAIRAVASSGSQKTPEIAYVGTTANIGPGTESDDDWEATGSIGIETEGEDSPPED